MNRPHPTTAETDTQTILLQLLQSILAFALIDEKPRTGQAALDAVGHIATKAAGKTPCSHLASTFDEEGNIVCLHCLEPL